MEHLLLSCIESRIESNRSLYSCFQLGPFAKGQGVTVANAMRRTLLSELSSLAIVCVEIQGVSHEYSNIKGVRESVLDILLNLKQIVFVSENFYTNPEIGFLKIQGPAIIKSCDLKLPTHLQCVDPNQYIATLSDNSSLEMKFMVCRGKSFIIQTSFELITQKFQLHFCNNRKIDSNISLLNKQNLGVGQGGSSPPSPYPLALYPEGTAPSAQTQGCRKKNSSEADRKGSEAAGNSFFPTENGSDETTTGFKDSINFSKQKTTNKVLKNQLFSKTKSNIPGKNKKSSEKIIKNYSEKHKSKRLISALDKNFFKGIEKILLSSNFSISEFQLFRNFIYKQNLKNGTITNVLLVDSVFMPVVKVNFSIQNIDNFYKVKNTTLINKFQKKIPQEKIFLEVWTNGSIDPKNAIHIAAQQIIDIFIPFQKTYFVKNQKNYTLNTNQLKSDTISTKNIHENKTKHTSSVSNSNLQKKSNFNSFVKNKSALFTFKTKQNNQPWRLRNISSYNNNGAHNFSNINNIVSKKKLPIFATRITYLSKCFLPTDNSDLNILDINAQKLWAKVLDPSFKRSEFKTSYSKNYIEAARKGKGVRGGRHLFVEVSSPPNPQLKSFSNKERFVQNIYTDNKTLLPVNSDVSSLKFKPAKDEKILITKKTLPFIIKFKQKSADIMYLNLSDKLYICLKRANINTIHEVTQHSKANLILIKGFSEKAIQQLDSALEKLNLKLKS